MSQVFISYSSADEQYALRLYTYLTNCGFTTWLAPLHIASGQDFSSEIGKELGWDKCESEEETISQRAERLDGAQAVILLLSKNSMSSVWVKREVVLAISSEKLLIPLQIDHEKLTSDYVLMLSTSQITPAYGLPRSVLEYVKSQLMQALKVKTPAGAVDREPISCNDIGMHSITMGDPYYVSGETLTFSLTKQSFYLSPPDELISEDVRAWTEEHFSGEDIIFDLGWDDVCGAIPIEDLRERIETSRRKVFSQFLNQENGCYYNNKKYGVYCIRPYGRTEDMSETPVLSMELYTTDYFTHRVMKDVCKSLISEGNSYFENIQYTNLGIDRIFFTSLGINLLLLDSVHQKEPYTILTCRSTNAAETYDRQQYSVSVIEGVSLSDYDPYIKTVNITSAVIRGLQEELGVKEHFIKTDTLHFYELFVNCKNLEIGLACSVELAQNTTIKEDVLKCRGKDEMIEIAEKRPVRLKELEQFVLLNRRIFLPQALFTILSYLDSVGVSLLDRHHVVARTAESFVIGKDGSSATCGDAIFQSKHFMAVIDCDAPETGRSWNGKPGNVYLAEVLREAMRQLEPECTAESAITFLNEQIGAAYAEHDIDFAALPPEERLQAGVIIYSAARKEIWNFGDCKLRINTENYDHTKKADILLAELRTFCIEAQQIRGTAKVSDLMEYGRAEILPYLIEETLFANTDCFFGYDVLNGGKINVDHIKIYAIKKGDHVVMASDGYPKLFDTLAESEAYLHDALKKDRNCMYILRGTKGVEEGCKSFDDRAFLSFVAK